MRLAFIVVFSGFLLSCSPMLERERGKEAASPNIILFMSDNGGLSVHGRGGTPHTHNLPLNSGKGSAI